MYQQLWGYKVEEKLYLGVREQKRLNTTDVDDAVKTDIVVFGDTFSVVFKVACRIIRHMICFRARNVVSKI
jgi:hypothetical protein